MVYVDRVLESLVLFLAVRAGVAALGIPFGDGQGALLRADLRVRRTPWAAIAVTAVLAAGYVLGLVWDGSLGTFSRAGSAESGWQLFTAPFVQEGALGGAFNVVTALVVLALAEWFWGAPAAVVVWLLGAWAPVSAAAAVVGYHVSQAHESAYSAGSSGATYFTAGTLCVAVLVATSGRMRWYASAAPAVGALMWALDNDGHGVMVLVGVLAGAVCAVVRAGVRPVRRQQCAVAR